MRDQPGTNILEIELAGARLVSLPHAREDVRGQIMAEPGEERRREIAFRAVPS